MLEQKIYLDNAATTALDPEVLYAMLPFMTNMHGNPSSLHSLGRETRLAVEKSRRSVAQLLNVKPTEIIFTSCGTESNNTAISAAVRDLGCRHIITSPIEHHAVLHTVDHLEKNKWLTVSHVKLLPSGQVDMEDLEQQLAKTPGKTLLTLMHANNELGNITDIGAVAALCRRYNVIYHADCVQTVGHYPIDLQLIKADFISASAHKFHGPKGSGILFIRGGIKIDPLIHGGGQERKLRAGTENVYGIVGFARALELAMANFGTDSSRIKSLKQLLVTKLSENSLPVTFNGDYENGLYTVLSVNIPKSAATELLLLNLDREGICVSGGSACTSGEGGSHVMRAINRDKDAVTIRFSFSKFNTEEEIETVAKTVTGMLIPVTA